MDGAKPEGVTCSVDGCHRSVYRRTMCNPHYIDLRRNDPASEVGLRYPPSRSGHSAHVAAERAGITYRQLDYWARCGYVNPTIDDASGSGTRRRYSDNDILKVRCLADLRQAGVELLTAVDLLRRIEDKNINFERVLFVVDGGAIEPRERTA